MDDQVQNMQLIARGQQFGELKVLYIDIIHESNMVPISRMNAICECSCGRKIKLSVNNLVSGQTTSCGCLGEYDIPDCTKEQVKVLSERHNVNIGIALSYIQRGMTDDEIIADNELFIPIHVGRKSIPAREIGDSLTIGNKRFIGDEPIEGYIGHRKVVYKRYLCKCGRMIYLLKKASARGMFDWSCVCDIIHEHFHGRVLSKASITDVTDSTKAVFDKSKCVSVGTYNGVCVHYTGDGGCLEELAYGKIPSRFKPGHACYQMGCKDDNLISRFSSIYDMLRL